jgi:hypothetical protein
MGRHKEYEVVKSIRVGLSQLEKTWLESHPSQSKLLNQLVKKAMSETTTLNPKIEEIVARAIARMSVEGVEVNCNLSRIASPDLDVVKIGEWKTKIIPCFSNRIIHLGAIEDPHGGVWKDHMYLVDCSNPFGFTVNKSQLHQTDQVRLVAVENIPEWMLAKLAEKND